MSKLIIIAPCYNEEEVIEESYSKLKSLLMDLIEEEVVEKDSVLCFVDDGSSDKTWSLIKKISEVDKQILGIKLSRNFGHQFAILAGLETMFNKFNYYLTIDVDLQDDISVIKEMILKQKAGSKIIYAVRNNRDVDSSFKRITATMFYKLMTKLGVKTIYNHADYRLIDNQILENFLKFKESNLFLRGIFPLVGFKSEIVYYKRKKREAGESKYPFKKMLSFALEGITSFSIKPLRLIMIVGVITFFISIAVGIWVLYSIFMGKTIQGWSSLMLVIIFFSSIQMLSIGLMGEYLGKIYKEVKNRPRFIVESIINMPKGDS